MNIRPIKDAKDLFTNELIYFKGHAQATYLSDGSTVESVLNETLKQGKYYELNDKYENPYLKFTNIVDNITNYWFCQVLNDTMYLGKTGNQITISNTGNITATAFYQTSDINKKNVIEDINIEIEDIANAPLVKFTYKDDSEKIHIGTIALYWKEVLPEVVNGEEGNYTLDYGTLAAINSISLAKIIEKLEKRISELEIELKNIKTFLQKQGENV